MSHVMNTYKRLPVCVRAPAPAFGSGQTGKRYLDALAGIAVCGLGHSHPRLVEAIAAQAGRLIHTSNLYEIPLQEQLADRLAAISGMDEVFFCNSGCEANEAAIRLRASTATARASSCRRSLFSKSVPRPHHRDALRNRQPQGAAGFERWSRFRARAVQRSRRNQEGRRQQPQRGGVLSS